MINAKKYMVYIDHFAGHKNMYVATDVLSTALNIIENERHKISVYQCILLELISNTRGVYRRTWSTNGNVNSLECIEYEKEYEPFLVDIMEYHFITASNKIK